MYMLHLCGCECTYRRETFIPSVVTLEDPVDDELGITLTIRTRVLVVTGIDAAIS